MEAKPSTPLNNGGSIDWDTYYGEIRDLYWDKDMTLGSVIQNFREKYGLKATKKQWKSKLETWNMFKNVKTNEMKAIVRVKDRRSLEGKATEFWVRDRPVPDHKIDRFVSRVRRTGATPAEATPFDVWYFTPREVGRYNNTSSIGTPYSGLLANFSGSNRPSPFSTAPEGLAEDDGEAQLILEDFIQLESSARGNELSDRSLEFKTTAKASISPSELSAPEGSQFLAPPYLLNGDEALLRAVRQDNLQRVTELVGRRAEGSSLQAALRLAIQLRFHDLLDILIRENDDVRAKAIYTIQAGDFEALKCLLRCDLSPFTLNVDRALSLGASKSREWAIIKILFSEGPDVNQLGPYYETTLRCARETRVSSLKEGLLAKECLIFIAIRNGYTNTVELLLKNGYPVDTVDDWGNTALHHAIRINHTGMVRILLHWKAEVGKNLHLAARLSRNEVLLELVIDIEDIDMVDDEGMTALDHALVVGNFSAQAILVSNGATERKLRFEPMVF